MYAVQLFLRSEKLSTGAFVGLCNFPPFLFLGKFDHLSVDHPVGNLFASLLIIFFG